LTVVPALVFERTARKHREPGPRAVDGM